MRDLYARPAPDLRKRIGHAAVAACTPLTRYCWRLINVWRNGGMVRMDAAEDERGLRAYQLIRVPVRDDLHESVRVTAARWEVSTSALLIRVFHTYAPFTVEILAQHFAEAPTKDTK